MRVLDLFSGLGGWSQAFRERGHDVLTLDIDKRLKPDVCRDILSVKSTAELYNEQEAEDWDIVLASPPCQSFSLASAAHHWGTQSSMYYPKDLKTVKGLNIAWHTFYLLYNSRATFVVIENPMGMMRNVIGRPTAEISQCQYGLPYRKRTDLWGRLPPAFVPKLCLDPGQTLISRGSRCEHMQRNHVWENDAKSRDTHWGDHTRMGAAKRAMIPYQLSLEMCVAAEKGME
jgi:hypothetical protein